MSGQLRQTVQVMRRGAAWPWVLLTQPITAREIDFQQHFLRQGRARRAFGIVMLAGLGCTAPWYAPAWFGVPAAAFTGMMWPLWGVMLGLIALSLAVNAMDGVRLLLIVTIAAMNLVALVYFTALRVSAGHLGFDVPTTIPASVLVGFAVLGGLPARVNLLVFTTAAVGGALSELNWVATETHPLIEIYGIIVLCIVGLVGSLAVEHAARSAWTDQAALTYRANHDDLTGLLSREFFHEHFDILLRTAERDSQPLSLAILDLDHFKRINDTHGHPVGDEVIRCVGEEIRLACRRGTDAGARLGGEEYALLLYGADAEAAQMIVERLMQRIRELRFHDARGQMLDCSVTSSAGLVHAQTQAQHTRDALITQADRLLYQAKNAGRDRMCAETAAVRPRQKPSMAHSA